MTSLQVKQWLSQGIAAAKAGDAERARDLLLQVVDADEYNEQAWLWLSSVVDTDADREVCMENVLAINPDNNLAKAGLVHLRRRRAPAPPLTPEPPPQPEPTPPTPAPSPSTASGDWLSQSQSASDSFLDERLAAAAKTDTVFEEKPKHKKRGRRGRRLVRRVALTIILGLGLLALGAGLILLVRERPFDTTIRDYATAMRPILDDYDAWWQGPYGALVGELDAPCGPTADGWRNRDVLLNCSRYPSMDCAHLAAHCRNDIDVTRQRIEKLSQQASQSAQKLLAGLEAISPPEEIAQDHARFHACLQAQAADAVWAGGLALGEMSTGPDHLPACQMFSTAEEKVRDYVNAW